MYIITCVSTVYIFTSVITVYIFTRVSTMYIFTSVSVVYLPGQGEDEIQLIGYLLIDLILGL